MKTKSRILIFVVAYNAEDHIVDVLDRIPPDVYHNEAYSIDVLIIDDCSSDATIKLCTEYQKKNKNFNISVMSTHSNQGYGGNQKLGYLYSVKHDYDAVVLLHGDGQYDPGKLHDVIIPIVEDRADVVFGSRMIHKKDALKGGMPMYKFIGNQILTKTQNWILGSNLTEFHTGYRAFRTQSLAKVPFEFCSSNFDFDTDIIIQLLDTKARILEVPMPTHYGKETCHVNGIKYAFDIVKSSIISRLQKFNILYDPKFDYDQEVTYQSKTHFDSSHSYAVNHVNEGSVVLDLGCGDGHVARELLRKDCKIFGIDRRIPKEAQKNFIQSREGDMEKDGLDFGQESIDTILMLDSLENLDNPEKFLYRLRQLYAPQYPQLILTTGNAAFFPIRLSFLLGHLNYSKKGIADLTKRKLFTFKSLIRTLKYSGYKVEKVDGIPVPFHFVFGEGLLNKIFTGVNKFLIKISKGLFSYQAAVIAKPKLTLEQTYIKIIDHTTDEKTPAGSKPRAHS